MTVSYCIKKNHTLGFRSPVSQGHSSIFVDIVAAGIFASFKLNELQFQYRSFGNTKEQF